MKSLTQDEAVIRSALVSSTVVVIVDDRIKSLTKAGNRATIILREIASDVPESEVRAIFEYENCKPIHSVRSDIGDTWFVVMESEEDAKDTLLDLKLKKRTFRGQSVKCRLKSEQSVRAFYSGSAPTSGGIAPMIPGPGMMQGGMMGMGGPVPNMYTPFNIVLPPAFIPAIPPFVTSTPVYSPTAQADPSHSSPAAPTSTVPASAESSGHGAGKAAAGDNTHSRSNKQSGGSGNPGKGGADTHSRKGKANSETGAAAASAGATGASSTAAAKISNRKIEMNSSNFPPLHEGGAAVAGSSNPVTQATQSEVPIATPGYKTAFHQYTYDDIISIVRNVQDATLPKTIVSDCVDTLCACMNECVYIEKGLYLTVPTLP